MKSVFEPEGVYHIYNHANGNENLFREPENYRCFLQKYVEHIYPLMETFAYCLMPNHFHLMVRVRKEEELKGITFQKFQTFGKFISKSFSNLFSAYTQAYNKKGSLFQPNFKRKLITNDSYFTALMAYIHNNPVHHGFVKEPDDWPHSSWHAYLSDRPTKMAKQEGLDWFGGKEEFVKLHELLSVRDIAMDFE